MLKRPLTPFESMDIRSLIDTHAERQGNHPFLIWEPVAGDGRTWSYGEFRTAVRRFAAGLEARGVTAGDRIIIHLENCPEGLIAWLGAAYAGIVPVTTNAQSTGDELAYFAEHSVAVGAITQPRYAALLSESLPDLPWLVTTDNDGGAVPDAPLAGIEQFSSIDGDPNRLIERPYDPWAPFGIQYTSGTTARPKAVLWTHANALWGGRLSAQHEDLRPDDVHLVHLPLFHTNAQCYSVLASLWIGSTIVLVPRFSASRFWPVSVKHNVTWTSMVPFCTRAVLAKPIPAQHSYRHWGFPVCSPGWEKRLGITAVGWWGMTETVTHGIVGAPHAPGAPMSMGRPAPGYEIYVLDDDGEPVAPGETGDLLVRGQRGISLFLEYAGDPTATAKAFREDGLFITGDRVRLGTDGSLYFADRSKDMLKVGGENVAASEIERVIAAVNGVAEVAVVAMRHPMLDEAPVAFVIPATEDDGLVERITEACAVSLAQFKRPHRVTLVDSLPRSTLAKVAKAELRAMANAER